MEIILLERWIAQLGARCLETHVPISFPTMVSSQSSGAVLKMPKIVHLDFGAILVLHLIPVFVALEHRIPVDSQPLRESTTTWDPSLDIIMISLWESVNPSNTAVSEGMKTTSWRRKTALSDVQVSLVTEIRNLFHRTENRNSCHRIEIQSLWK